MKKLLIASSDFQELTGDNIYYVDKSSMLATFINSQDKVTLITRPRRWGKSLNLSMLWYFLLDNGDGGATKCQIYRILEPTDCRKSR